MNNTGDIVDEDWDRPDTPLERFLWISFSLSKENSGCNNTLYISPPQDGPVEIKVVPAVSGLRYVPDDAAHILLDDEHRPYLDPGKNLPPTITRSDLDLVFKWITKNIDLLLTEWDGGMFVERMQKI